MRCSWVGDDPVYTRYHDEEWGVPVRDDRTQFEFLILESAQAGLNWLTILKRRGGYQQVFHDFDPEKVARMSEAEIRAALQNPGIIRNERKVRAAIKNAQVFLKIQQEFGSFTDYIWGFVGGRPIINHWESDSDVPATTELSERLSKDLKSRGMSFVGGTIIYAHLQATGLVQDHLTSCFRYAQLTGTIAR